MRKMKETGIKWLGEIPIEWKTLRLKNIATFRRGTQIRKEDCEDSGVPLINYGQIHSKLNSGTSLNDKLIRFAPSSLFENKTPIYKGDLLFAATSEDLDAIGAAVFVDRDEVYAGSDSLICHFEKEDYTKYFAYLALTHQWRDQIRQITNGIKVFHLTQERLSNAIVTLPSFDERKRIVEYLDEKCVAIDSAIGAAERSIEEYKLYRQSVIFEVVTKGLDPDAPMKDSEIEWLGKIPDSWPTVAISQLADQTKTPNDGMKETNLLSLSYGKIKRRDIDATKGLLPASFEGYNIVEPDDVVLRFTDLQNDQKSLRVGRVVERGIITSAYTTIRPSNAADSEYLYYCLHSYDLRKGFYGMGAGVRQGLKWQEAKYIEIPWPTLEERNRITASLDMYCERIDSAIEAKKFVIDELKLYKKSLIYEVVTGKREIDGR